MQTLYTVIKRDGREEPFKLEKLEKVITLCAGGLNIDLQHFLRKLTLTLQPKIRSSEIQRNLINTAINLVVSQKNKTDWSIFANRLLLIDFKKRIRLQRGMDRTTKHGFFKKFDDFYEHVKGLVDKGIYTAKLLKVPKHIFRTLYHTLLIKDFTNPLWNIKHMQLQKFIKSYLIEVNNQPVETPEEVWLLQSLLGFLPSYKSGEITADEYIEKVKRHFWYLSNFIIVPATPQMLNLRRAKPNLSSCFVLDVHDTTESIVHTQTQIAHISRNAGGVGLFLGRLRPSGSAIKGNFGLANSILEWVKLFESTVESFNQQGKRKGSLTVSLPIWHKDIIDFLESIDTDIGETTKKAPNVFTQVVVPNWFIDYLNEHKEVYLLDMHEIVDILGREDLDLIDSQGEEAKQRYLQIVELIKQGKVKNYKKIDGRQILRKIFYYWSRKGLPYITFEDNLNKFSPFKEKIYAFNLCVENTSPFRNTNPSDNYEIEENELGYIHSCNITNLNLYAAYKHGILFDDEKLEQLIDHVYEYMDNLLELQDLPVREAKKHNEKFRTVTLGFIGLADVLVGKSLEDKRFYGYRLTTRKVDKQPTFELLDKIFGKIAFLVVLASTRLARKRGRLPWFEKTKYTDKILLGRWDLKNDEHRQFIASLIGQDKLNELEQNLERYGIRNSMLLNAPPNTSTSILAGVTASILPPFNLVQLEDKQKSVFIHFVPELENGALYYDVYSKFSDINDYKDLIDIVSHIQQFIDSGISFEIVVNHNHFNTAQKLTLLYSTIFSYARRKGIKALYYWRHILPDQSSTTHEVCEGCAS